MRKVYYDRAYAVEGKEKGSFHFPLSGKPSTTELYPQLERMCKCILVVYLFMWMFT